MQAGIVYIRKTVANLIYTGSTRLTVLTMKLTFLPSQTILLDCFDYIFTLFIVSVLAVFYPFR